MELALTTSGGVFVGSERVCEPISKQATPDSVFSLLHADGHFYMNVCEKQPEAWVWSLDRDGGGEELVSSACYVCMYVQVRRM